MGGGLFGTPLYLNPKCLVFSAILLAVHWMPRPVARMHQWVLAFFIGMSAYISLAWYDTLYDCNDRLRPTLLGWLSMPFKPQEYQQAYHELPLKYQKIIRTVDILVLAIVLFTFVFPFLVKSTK